jgi:hypothetical protein
MSAVLSAGEAALLRIEAGVRELSAALRDADEAGLQPIDIIPVVIATFSEEGVAFDMSKLGGLLG